MKIWDLVTSVDYFDYDTYDNEYDAIVTICIDKEDEANDDPYYQFIVGLCKKVDVVDSEKMVMNWTKFIRDNIDLFRAFAEEHWYRIPEDLIYAWINEIHYYIAGYTSDAVYQAFIDKIIDHCR